MGTHEDLDESSAMAQTQQPQLFWLSRKLEEVTSPKSAAWVLVMNGIYSEDWNQNKAK